MFATGERVYMPPDLRWARRSIGYLFVSTHPLASIRELTHASLTTTAQHFEGW
jgi:hypothetical protein